MSRDARVFRDWAEARGHPAPPQPKIEADEKAASTFVALAVRVTKAAAYYKGPGGNSAVIITFGPATLTAADGSVPSFNIDIEHALVPGAVCVAFGEFGNDPGGVGKAHIRALPDGEMPESLGDVGLADPGGHQRVIRHK